MTWDPTQYLKFEGHRVRPAIELLQRIDANDPQRVVDLGCGTGNTTILLADRWPDAEHVGVDKSAAMLAVAEHDRPDLTWVEADVETWDPTEKFDVVFSNAALHWIDDHDTLLPRLLELVVPGGTFAFQAPANFAQPTHTAAVETAMDGPWQETLEPLIRQWPVLDPVDYSRLLSGRVAEIDVWQTTYVQRLEGDNPVAQWTKGSALRPYLDALSESESTEFFTQYAARISAAYPVEPDGCTLLPFRRIFVVATLPLTSS